MTDPGLYPLEPFTPEQEAVVARFGFDHPDVRPVDRPLNPDCYSGKHQACRGDAWSACEDRPCDCSCDCHKDAVS